jgi:peptidyl-prolyl cis-trans isomerase B (cyclophilin B)
MKKILVTALLVFIAMFLITGCGSVPTEKPSNGAPNATEQYSISSSSDNQTSQNTEGKTAPGQATQNQSNQEQTTSSQNAQQNTAPKEEPKQETTTKPAPVEQPPAKIAPQKPAPEPQKVSGKNPVVTIEMMDGKKIVAELYPKIAPNTVNNFISLIKKGFYDGLIFQRVIPEFMIQGGDPEGTGAGGPGYSIKGEFTENGFKNDLLHTKGVLSMARTQDPDTAGSQFFIMAADVPDLDYKYASFGKVLSGIEEVDKIVSAERDGSDKPLQEQKMKKVTVDTFGVNYPEPIKQ